MIPKLLSKPIKAIRDNPAFWKTACLLWILCLIGKLSLFPYLSQKLMHMMTWGAYLKVVLFDALVYAIVIMIGLGCANKVNLSAHVDQDIKEITWLWCLKIVVIGVVMGFILLCVDKIVFPLERYYGLESSVGHIGWNWNGILASLYGGINEEVILRLFLMSFVAFILMKLFKGKYRTGLMLASIVLTALLFGALHLPAAAQLWALTPFIIARILVLNGIAGLVLGYLYFRQNLLAAMIAHFSADVVLHGLFA